MDFLSVLNKLDSTKNPNDIRLKIPKISQPDQTFVISSPCNITSNCNTVINSKCFEIKTSDITFSNLTFETSFNFSEANNISFINCVIKTPKSARFGLSIINCKNFTLNKVDISGESTYGIFISASSTVTLNELTIHDIPETLVVVRGNSKVTMTKSKLFNTKYNCMNSEGNCDVSISESLFDNAESPNLYIIDSKFSIKSSELKNTKQTLLIIEKVTDFSIENNLFENSEIAAIYTEKSKGIIKGNKFVRMQGNGVNCFDYSDAQILNNDFYDLKYPAITVTSKSKAIISGNKIEKDEINGISIRDTLNVLIQNNEIKDVLNCGISVSDCDRITISNNKISNCKVTAIESYNKSNVCACNNVISNIEKYAFLAYTSGQLNVVENEISDVKIAMVKLAFKGGGEFINNKISNCPKQCECQTSSVYFFNKNGQFFGVTNDKDRMNDSVKFEEKFVDTNVSKLCLKCKAKPHNCFLLDCGHNVYCKECAELALKNKEFCPLCRWNIEKVSQGFNTSEDNTCIICLSNEPNCIILPCGHMGVCSDCLENWLKKSKTCPICRTDTCFYKEIKNNNI